MKNEESEYGSSAYGSQRLKTNFHSSLFTLHSSFNRLFTKELKIMNYEL